VHLLASLYIDVIVLAWLQPANKHMSQQVCQARKCAGMFEWFLLVRSGFGSWLLLLLLQVA
jgi:hypothetical protein